MASKYELRNSESEEYFDAFIEAGFAKSLDADQMVQVLRMLTEILTSDMANQLCEGISFLQVNEKSLTIQLR